MTPKQRRFVAEYRKDLNATQAAIRAGYSRANADVVGPRLLGSVGVREALAAAQQKTAEKLELTAESILRRIDDEAKAAEEPRDRLKALELLGKHLKLFTDKVEHSGQTVIQIVTDSPPRDFDG